MCLFVNELYDNNHLTLPTTIEHTQKVIVSFYSFFFTFVGISLVVVFTLGTRGATYALAPTGKYCEVVPQNTTRFRL